MKVCNNCRQTNPDEAMFCRQCAGALGGGQAQQQYANPQQNPFVNQQQQQWNQPNFGNQPVQNFAQNTGGGASGRATASAILAVVGLLCCGLAGIVGAVLGWLELQAIKEGKSPAAGQTMAQIGLWLGIIGFVINVAVSFIFFILGALGGR